jgi:hypothetical protein
MKRSYGGRVNEFNYFYVEKSENSKNKGIFVKTQKFKSNKGAFLGQSLNDFKKSYKEINFKIKSYSDTVFYEFEKENDIYKSKYIFFNDTLLKYEFGYQD